MVPLESALGTPFAALRPTEFFRRHAMYFLCIAVVISAITEIASASMKARRYLATDSASFCALPLSRCGMYPLSASTSGTSCGLRFFGIRRDSACSMSRRSAVARSVTPVLTRRIRPFGGRQ